MTSRFWPLPLVKCPQCGDTGRHQVTGLLISADGEIHIDFECPNCKTKYWFEKYDSYFRHHALCCDIEAHLEARKPKPPSPPAVPLRPPLKPAPDPEEIINDRNFLHLFKISDPDEVSLLPPPRDEEPPDKEAA